MRNDLLDDRESTWILSLATLVAFAWSDDLAVWLAARKFCFRNELTILTMINWLVCGVAGEQQAVCASATFESAILTETGSASLAAAADLPSGTFELFKRVTNVCRSIEAVLKSSSCAFSSDSMSVSIWSHDKHESNSSVVSCWFSRFTVHSTKYLTISSHAGSRSSTSSSVSVFCFCFNLN